MEPIAVYRLPLFLVTVFSFLVERLERRCHYPCAEEPRTQDVAFRVDARADRDSVTLGGWLPQRSKDGGLTKQGAPWFSVELDRAAAPWAYTKEGGPQRAIAALEAMATLLGVVLLSPAGSSGQPLRAQLVLPALTDNRGNALALARLATVKFPLTLVACELSAQLEARSMRLSLDWVPREFNVEADALSNGDVDGFDPAQRKSLDVALYPWLVLRRLQQEAAEFYGADATDLTEVVVRRRRGRNHKGSEPALAAW